MIGSDVGGAVGGAVGGVVGVQYEMLTADD